MKPHTEILYVSSSSSNGLFKEVFDKSIIKPSPTMQKFHNLFMQGFAKNDKCGVTALTQVSNNDIKKKSEETENNIDYKYFYTSKNIYSYIMFFINIIEFTFKWNLKNKKNDRVIVCTISKPILSNLVIFTSFFFGVKTVGIVADIPGLLIKEGNIISKVLSKFAFISMSFYKSYVLLTEQMNEIVNKKGKPFVVIEGLVDSNILVNNSNFKKTKKRKLIYAGGIFEIYGISTLIEAFMLLDNYDDIELHIYGDGDLRNKMDDYCKRDQRIKYFGSVHNDVVVKELSKATLLINPRPTSGEFTRYSFPSKNLEYMASGTPLLTTPLEGIPDDHYDFIFTFNDQTVVGMRNKLDEIINKNDSELYYFGKRAQEFVLKNKNNIQQANRILNIFNEK